MYYNNGKVKIGIYYEKPKYVEEDPDMLLLQRNLIYDRSVIRKERIERIFMNFAVSFVLLIILLQGIS